MGIKNDPAAASAFMISRGVIGYLFISSHGLLGCAPPSRKGRDRDMPSVYELQEDVVSRRMMSASVPATPHLVGTRKLRKR